MGDDRPGPSGRHPAYLNDELLAARDAMARPAGGPQSRPQAPAAQDTPAAPATAGKVSAGV
jgi:hypothetical protein